MSDDVVIPKDAGTVRVDRRFLLFQIDTTKAGFLRTFGGRDPYTGQARQDLPGAFRVLDPLEWEDPSSPAYWRNVLSGSYSEDVNALWKTFRTNFIRAAVAGEIDLRVSPTGAPFRDITPLVRQVSGYSVSLEAFNNNLVLDLGPDESRLNPKSFISFRGETPAAGAQPQVSLADQLAALANADVGENDVIMVRTGRPNRDGAMVYELEFLGFVGKVKATSNYGSVFSKTVQVFGISKLFAVSTVIKQQSIQDRFATDPSTGLGVAVSSSETPSPLEHRFNGMNAKEVFATLIREVLAWEPYPKPKSGQTSGTPATGTAQNPNATLYAIDPDDILPGLSGTGNNSALVSAPEQLAAIQRGVAMGEISDAQASAQSAAIQAAAAQVLQAFDGFSFQFNVFTLMTLLLMAKASSADLPVEEARLYGAGNPQTSAAANIPSLLGKDGLAVVEHGDHKVWNDLVASGYENFFSQTATPDSIFAELRSTTLYDVFESRNGTIIARPPRYNRIEVSVDDYRREFVDTPGALEKIFVRREDGDLGPRLEFNPDADFVIASNNTVSDIDSEKEDFELESRVDTKWTMPYVGPQDFPAGDYTDPNLLVKYGLRTRGPVDNPNVTNENLAKLFSPVVLGMVNAKTRKTSVSVVDTRDYRIGKLYYVEDIGQVGYAVSSEIGHAYGQVSKHNLDLVMLRRVIWVGIDEIKKSENAILDFAMTYLSDPTPADIAKANQVLSRTTAEATAGAGSAPLTSMMKDLIERGKTWLNALSSYGFGDSTKIPVFKYIPTIMDVIVQVDDEPDIAVPDKSKTDKTGQAKVDQTRAKIGFHQAVCLGGRFYATELPFTPKTLPAGTVDEAKVQELAKEARTEADDREFFGAHGWSNFNPLCGFLGYEGVENLETMREPSTDGKTGRPYFLYKDGNGTKNPLIATPFYSSSISADPSDFVFSQVLINRLAVIDLTMKYFRGPNVSFDPSYKISLGVNVYPNTVNGFPQYYNMRPGSDGSKYDLFGTYMDPHTYTRANETFGRAFMAFVFSKRGPNALFFDTGTWKSDSFEIASAGSFTFKMPFGHIMSRDALNLPIFYRLSGGTYEITYDAARATLNVKAITGYVYSEEAVSVAEAARINPNATPTPPTTPSSTASSAAADMNKFAAIPVNNAGATTPQFCFLTPFAEPTIERIFELGLPADLCGYRKAAKTDELTAKAAPLKVNRTPFAAENDAHLGFKNQPKGTAKPDYGGRAFDIALESVIYASGSDLVIIDPEAGGKAWARLNAILEQCKFGPTGKGQAFPIQAVPPISYVDNINVLWTYPDGKDGANSPVPIRYYYHVVVSKEECWAYADRADSAWRLSERLEPVLRQG